MAKSTTFFSQLSLKLLLRAWEGATDYFFLNKLEMKTEEDWLGSHSFRLSELSIIASVFQYWSRELTSFSSISNFLMLQWLIEKLYHFYPIPHNRSLVGLSDSCPTAAVKGLTRYCSMRKEKGVVWWPLSFWGF